MAADKAMAAEIDRLMAQHMAYLTRQMADGSLSVADWQIAMRADIRRAHALQMIAGAGGPENVMPNDWLKLGSTVRSQDGYLEDFARQIASGKVDPASATSRAELYAKSAKQTFSKQATKDVIFPTYPGQQQCMGNCGCEWVDNGDGSYSWVRSKDDSCPDCIRNEQTYRNYVPEVA